MKKIFMLFFACIFSAFSSFAVVGNSAQLIDNQRVAFEKSKTARPAANLFFKKKFWRSAKKMEANDLAVYAQMATIFGAISLFIGIALVIKMFDLNNSTPEKGGGFILAGFVLLAISIILGFWAFAKKSDQKNRLILTLFINFFLLALLGFLFLR